MKKTYLAAGRGVHAVSACFRCLLLIPIFVLGCFGAHAAAQTQQAVSRVSLDVRDAAIVTVFQTIQQQTGCSFVYNTSDIDTDRKVTVSAQDEPLTALLDKLFAGSDIAYTLRDKHIVLSKKTKNSPPHNAQGGVSGTVKDAQGMPLIGATVLIQGTTTGVAVDLDGNFSLPQAKVGDTLEISLIGYAKQTLPVTGSAPLQVVMLEDNEVLDAVVVTALGIKRAEKSLTYNVQEVAGDIVTSVKDANFMNSLVGKVAGVQINSGASGPGASARVVMRGEKSIEKGNNVLYVIDGIPMYNHSFGGDGGTYAKQAGSESAADINPEDIESINMLTGPSAAALYGSDAANGVVVINTKRGVKDRTVVTVSNSTTFSKVYRLPDMQNSYGTSSGLMNWGEKYASTFDAKKFFNTGTNIINSVSVSTGNEKNQTYISASTTNTAGILSPKTNKPNARPIRRASFPKIRTTATTSRPAIPPRSPRTSSYWTWAPALSSSTTKTW